METLQALVNQPERLIASDRVRVLSQLRAEIVHRDEKTALDIETLESLCHAAHCWSDWPLLDYLATLLQQADSRVDWQYYRRALCEWHRGNTTVALANCRQALLLNPHEQDSLVLYRDLQAWWSFCQQYDCYRRGLMASGELSIELLGHHHIDDFRWLYHDAAITELCQLPEYHADAQWHTWVDDEYARRGALLFAIIHREWGMIGVTSLMLHRGVGFFYYWVGAEFRGQGYAPAAVSQLLDTAGHCWDLKCCYAQAYRDNLSSHRGLQKLGFTRLNIAAQAPHDDQLFFRRGPLQTRQQTANEMHTLFSHIHSNTRIAVPLVA